MDTEFAVDGVDGQVYIGTIGAGSIWKRGIDVCVCVQFKPGQKQLHLKRRRILLYSDICSRVHEISFLQTSH